MLYLLKEIALTELAVAITAILLRKGHYGDDTTIALVDLRKRINDFSLKFESRGDILYIFKGDTVHFKLHITDRSGNKSNVITTPDFIAFEED